MVIEFLWLRRMILEDVAALMYAERRAWDFLLLDSFKELRWLYIYMRKRWSIVCKMAFGCLCLDSKRLWHLESQS